MDVDEDSWTGNKPNYLKNVLSETELSEISESVAEKLNSFIERQRDDFTTTKALLEVNKIQNVDKGAKISELTMALEDTNKKILLAEESKAEMLKKFDILKVNFEQSNTKISNYEREIEVLKKTNEISIDERNEAITIVERQSKEFERLKAFNESNLLELKHAKELNYEIMSHQNELQNKSLHASDEIIIQERNGFKAQISALNEEIERLTANIQSADNCEIVVKLEAELREVRVNLGAANTKTHQLIQENNQLNDKCEDLTRRLYEQHEIGDKLSKTFTNESHLKSKETNLYKTLKDNAEFKAMQLAETVEELKKLVDIATDKYDELDTKFKNAEIDFEEENEKNNEKISLLERELVHANELLAPNSAHELRGGMTLTQLYSRYQCVSSDLTKERQECQRLRLSIESIIEEIKERAPALKKDKQDLEETTEANMVLTQYLDSLSVDNLKLKHDLDTLSKTIKHYTRENEQLKTEVIDLQKQTCLLLSEIEQNRRSSHSNRNLNSSNSSKMNTSQDVMKFRDIEELQSNNHKLVRMVRELTEKHNHLEHLKEQFDSGLYQNKIKSLEKKITELTDAQARQTKSVTEIISQRDLYKKLCQDYSIDNPNIKEQSSNMNRSIIEDVEMKDQKLEDCNTLENKLKHTEEQLQIIKEVHKKFKEEKNKEEKKLLNDIVDIKREMNNIITSNSETTEYSKKEIIGLQELIAEHKKKIVSLEEKERLLTSTVKKQGHKIQDMRNEIKTLEHKLNLAQTSAKKYEVECQRQIDLQILQQCENKAFVKEHVQNQLVIQSLDQIKTQLDTDHKSYARLQARFNDVLQDSKAVWKRLEDEQDQFREEKARWQKEAETAKLQSLQEKEAADVLRAEVTQLKQSLEKYNCTVDSEQKPVDDTNNLLNDYLKQITEQKNKILEQNQEILKLQKQIDLANESIQNYSNISQNAEKCVKELNEEYSNYKMSTNQQLSEFTEKLRNLQDHCSELEAELSLQCDEEDLTKATLKSELENTACQLKECLETINKYENLLENAQVEKQKLTELIETIQQKHSQEVLEHSVDKQSLKQATEDIAVLRNQLKEVTTLKDIEVANLESTKISWLDRESTLNAEIEQLKSQVDTLNSQNSLLLDKLQTLGVELSISMASRSLTDSRNESCNMNTSTNESDEHSSEQFLTVINFLRKEKDAYSAKCNTLQREVWSLKSELEVCKKQLDDTNLALDDQKNNSEVTSVLQSNIITKIDNLGALSENNRYLRLERDRLKTQINNLTDSIKTLEDQVLPLQNNVSELTTRNAALETENLLLNNDLTSWKSRVNKLAERANKVTSDDWKRLQNEKDYLVKALTAEKESVKKLSDELGSVKIEKIKLDDQHSLLNRRLTSLSEDNKKISLELQKAKDDLPNIVEQNSRMTLELDQKSETISDLKSELSDKETSLLDIKTKEQQIRKIAKKYKIQYEELLRNTEEDKADEKIDDDRINELRTQLEKLRSELDSSMEKEDKAKNLLKLAKEKINRLNAAKAAVEDKLEECQTKVESFEKSNNDEEDKRLELLNTQYEIKISKLEKEKENILYLYTDQGKEIDTLTQKINLLEQQLATQSNLPKQVVTTDKTATDAPTANVKLLASTSSPAVSGPCLESTEYMPASSSLAESRTPALLAAPPREPRAIKRPRPPPPGRAKRPREDEERDQEPSSSHQGDEGVVLLDSDDEDEKEVSDTDEDEDDDDNDEENDDEDDDDIDEENIDEEPEMDEENIDDEPDMDEENIDNEPEMDEEEDDDMADNSDSEPEAVVEEEEEVVLVPRPQIEAISSGTEPVLEEGEDGIVPSTPVLRVPRAGDGFGEAVVSPLVAGARFSFAEDTRPELEPSHSHSHPDLAAAMPQQVPEDGAAEHSAVSATNETSRDGESGGDPSRS